MNGFRAIALTAAAAVVVVGFAVTPAKAQQRKVYAVKFLCGEYEEDNAAASSLCTGAGVPFPCCTGLGTGTCRREGPVKPGNYQTAINIHNPTFFPTFILKRAVLMFDEANPPAGFELPMPPGPFNFILLNSRWGVEIDCGDIRQVLLSQAPGPPFTFLKGYVVLETFLVQNKLDVVAAYTSHGFVTEGVCSGPGILGPGCDSDADCPTGAGCRDMNGECLSAGTPWPCCTGAGVGVCRTKIPTGFSTDVERVEPVLIP